MPLYFVLMLFGQSIYEMDEIVVTANRYPTLLQDVTVAVMIIERAEIEQLKALGLNELLNIAAGMEFKDYGTPGGVTSISTRGIPANGTLVLVNGQPLNAVSNGMADLSVIDINTIERIEIVKGPVSSIYGANALGGVVNIITVSEARRKEMAMGFTSATTNTDDLFQTTNAHTRLYFPVKNTTLQLAGAYNQDAGSRSNSDLTEYNATAAILHETGRMSFRSSFFYDNKDYGIPGPLPRVDSAHLIPQFGDSTSTSLFDRQQDHTLMGNVRLGLHVSEKMKYYGSLFANRQFTQFHTVYPGIMGDTVREDYDYLLHKIGLNTMITLDAGKMDYTLGLDASYDTLQTTVRSTAINDTTWHAGSYDIGAWGELRMSLTHWISLSSSVRYDRNSQFGDFLSPGIGIVGILNQSIWLKLSAGKTFRAPTFNDLYWPHYGNPLLKPEYGWAYELRAETSPWPTLFAALSLFARNIDDRIAWMPGSDDLWRPQNLNFLNVKGMDLEVKHYLSDFFSYTLNATYLDAQQKNEEIVYSYYDWINDTSLTIFEEIKRPAAFTPKLTIASSFNFTLPAGIKFNIAGRFLSERINYYPNYDDYPYVSMDTKKLGGKILINTALTVIFFKNLSMTAGIKNVADADYALQFGNTFDDLDYPMPRRTYFARWSLFLGRPQK